MWASKFINDKRGRIPFAVLGVFLIIGSAVTSGVITGLEQSRSEELSASLSSSNEKYLMYAAEADLSTALNEAGMKGLKKIGKNPVIETEEEVSDLAENLIGNNRAPEDDADSDDDGDIEGGETIQFNKNWARYMTMHWLNDYIKCNYLYDTFHMDGYALNVRREGGNNPINATADWDKLELTEVTSDIDRSWISDFPGGPGDRENVPTYWRLNLSLPIEIKNLSTGKVVEERNLEVSTLVTSRFPLLQSLMDEFEGRLNEQTVGGLFSPLQTEVTALSLAYTEARGLMKYFTQDTPANITANPWLTHILNDVMLLEQGMVFNTINPMSLIEVLLNLPDLFATDTGSISTDAEQITNVLEDGIPERLGSVLSGDDPTISEESQQPDTSHINLQDIGENILRDYNYGYEYKKIDSDGNELPSSPEMFWEDNGFNFEDHGSVFEEDNVRYIFQPANETVDGETVNLSYSERRAKDFKERTINMVNNIANDVYAAHFYINYTRTHTDEIASSTCDGDSESTGDWQLSDYHLVDSEGPPVDLSSGLIYKEEYSVEWTRSHTYKDYYNGSVVCSDTVTDTRNENVTLKVYSDDYASVMFEEEYVDWWNINPPSHHHPGENIEDAFSGATYTNESGTYPDHNLNKNFDTYKEDYYVSFRDEVLEDGDKTIDGGYQYPGDSRKEVQEISSPPSYQPNWLQDNILHSLVKLLDELRDIDQQEEGNIDIDTSGVQEAIESGMSGLQDRLNEYKTSLLDDDNFTTDSGEYTCAAAKATALSRVWFVYEIENRLEQGKNDAFDEFTGMMQDALSNFDVGGNIVSQFTGGLKNQAKDFMEGRLSLLLEASLPCDVSSDSGCQNWNENLGLTYQQSPDYLNAEQTEDGEWVYDYKVRNLCLFGPTGLPILPPIGPLPWIVTANAWFIHIEGAFNISKLSDTKDETHPHPLFGHKPQTYNRKARAVRVFGELLGWNQAVSFGFDTLAVAVTPPSKLCIGDDLDLTRPGLGINEEDGESP